ncbi:MAG: DUF86 domain-containing protein [Syntrophobacteraceae bacterium]
MVDKELISRKLSRLRSYVDALRRSEDINREKYRTDLRTRAFVERYIHLSIEEMIDVANHFVSFHQWREPTSFRDLFSILREHDIIPEKHLLTFQRMASFRNILVHRYENIDDELVFGIFTKHLGDFDLFIRLVTDWVREHP